jgi:hypothetical protein
VSLETLLLLRNIVSVSRFSHPDQIIQVLVNAGKRMAAAQPTGNGQV